MLVDKADKKSEWSEREKERERKREREKGEGGGIPFIRYPLALLGLETYRMDTMEVG